MPSTKVELHGILFDTESMLMSLPKDKVDKALLLVDAMFKKGRSHCYRCNNCMGCLILRAEQFPRVEPFLGGFPIL